VSRPDERNQSKKQKPVYSTLVKFQVVVAIVAVAVTIAVVLEIGPLIEKKENLKKEIDQKEIELVKIKKEIDRKEEELADIKKEIEYLEPRAEQGLALGFKFPDSSDNSSIPEQNLKAAKYVNELVKLSTDADIERRKRISIEYFPKEFKTEVNIRIVVPSLQKFGFQVEKKSPKVDWLPTNSVWFGTNVKIEDVKLVAYTLISAGVQIKNIRPFISSRGRKASLIQIGAVDYVKTWPVLRVEEIREKTVFTRERRGSQKTTR
jgi:cell division protein FtsB